MPKKTGKKSKKFEVIEEPIRQPSEPEKIEPHKLTIEELEKVIVEIEELNNT